MAFRLNGYPLKDNFSSRPRRVMSVSLFNNKQLRNSQLCYFVWSPEYHLFIPLTHNLCNLSDGNHFIDLHGYRGACYQYGKGEQLHNGAFVPVYFSR